jgi:hypothetical protein
MTDLSTTSVIDPDTLQEEVQRAKERLTELRRKKKIADLARARELRKAAGIPEKSHHKAPAPETAAESATDFAYGAVAIGKEIGQPASSIYYRFAQGQFPPDTVWKWGERTLVGSKSKLRSFRPPQ